MFRTRSNDFFSGLARQSAFFDLGVVQEPSNGHSQRIPFDCQDSRRGRDAAPAGKAGALSACRAIVMVS